MFLRLFFHTHIYIYISTTHLNNYFKKGNHTLIKDFKPWQKDNETKGPFRLAHFQYQQSIEFRKNYLHKRDDEQQSHGKEGQKNYDSPNSPNIYIYIYIWENIKYYFDSMTKIF